MTPMIRCLGALASALLCSCSVAPVTPDSAAYRLQSVLVRDCVFAHLPERCLVIVHEDTRAGRFLFAVRYDQELCSGDSASALVDRFAVRISGGAIEHYDVARAGAPSEFVPYDRYRSGPTSPN